MYYVATFPYGCDSCSVKLIWNILKQITAARNISYNSSPFSKEMTRNSLGEITHEDWIKARNHVKTIKEQRWPRSLLLEEATRNMTVNTGM